MKCQWILYNQLGKHCMFDDVDSYCVLHTDGPIETHTSAGRINLNIYSKLIGYSAAKAFVDSVGGDFIEVDDRLAGLIAYAGKHDIVDIVVMDSCEPYVSTILVDIQKKLEKQNITLDIRPNNQFIISRKDFTQQFDAPPVMETFYRWMRKRGSILMDVDKPVGGKRNYDKENRKYDKTFEDTEHPTFASEYRDQALEYFEDDIARYGKPIHNHFPVTRDQSLELLQHFVDHHIDRFGELEDAMYDTSDYVYHSLISVPLNFGLLTPEEVLQSVLNTDTAINNKEGFVRQVLGWREYMHQRLWYYKDDLYKKNHLNHTHHLPSWFWETDDIPIDMHCVSHVLKKVENTGYSHHIERLMIIGNFCMLVGYDPHEVNRRFWEQYADAFERVVSPNVLGMSQYADGGKLATKPYISSANYVNKMSNYCSSCVYDPKEKYGENACPLNYLYRKFVNANQETLKQGRQGFILSHLKKLDIETINTQSDEFIQSVVADKKY